MKNQSTISGAGRKRDPKLNDVILSATVDVLTDIGYVRMTMDAVAKRAGTGKATLYRRWSSKSELVLEAVTHLQKHSPGISEPLPDTGSLRGDLLALFVSRSDEQTQRKLDVMVGIATVLAYDAALADLSHGILIKPWADAVQTLIQRAKKRGEVTPTKLGSQTLSTVLPSMAINRALLERKPSDSAFIESVIDDVILPSLR